jgi:phospholipid-translocating ATPase
MNKRNRTLMPHGNFLFRWYERFDLVKIFSREHVPGPPRTVFVHEELPPEYFTPKGRVKDDYVYVTNQVITSKYTIFSFIPRNLLEQFRRIANM